MHDRVTRGPGEVTVAVRGRGWPADPLKGSAEDLRHAGILPEVGVLPDRIHVVPDLLAREQARSAAVRLDRCRSISLWRRVDGGRRSLVTAAN